MKKNYSTTIIILILLFVSLQAIAQNDNDFPVPSEAEVPGAKILQSKYFDGNALWGHINGGADLYLEYGFDKLLFQEIELNSSKLRIEYYRMNDAPAAFGIFSVSHFRCDLEDTLTKFICITNYQVQAALGRFYISIANDKGTKEAQKLTIEYFEKILTKCNEQLFELPENFIRNNLLEHKKRIKLFRGTLGLQNGMEQWLDLFEKFSGYEISVLPFENENGYLNYAHIKFVNEEDKLRFMRTIGVNETKTENRFVNNVNGIFYIVKTVTPSEIYFYETVFREEEIKKILDNL